ncbi:hypothetical protein WJX81_001494 [Elliptochloris bilobata]|uniref:Anaphase-promoting complex subunit 4 n=1 Tax=Elliptochloris bilobata TaxID=381761 RepID=A0AAW1S8E7_9CHLO
MADEAAAFTRLLDKGLTADVSHAAWSPTMDLLALVTADGQLCVHRLNWQRLWAITPEHAVTALCWRPDGKALAASAEDGAILVLDVENGEVLLRGQLAAGAVACLSWAEEAPAAGKHADAESLLPRNGAARFCGAPATPLPPPGRVPPQVYDFCRQPVEDTALAWPELPPRLSLLCAADCRGRISVYASSLFPLAEIDVAALAADARGSAPSITVLQVAVSGDLARMHILFQEGLQGAVQLLVVSTGCISQRRTEIRRLAFLASHILSLLSGAEVTLRAASEAWAEGVVAVADKVVLLRGLMRKHSGPADPVAELLALLACGHVSNAMHQFLSANLGEGGIKRLAKAVDAAASAVASLLAEHAQPALEAAAFQLAELHGLAHCTRWLAPLGVEEREVAAAEAQAAALLVRVEALRRTVISTAAEYRRCFDWLLQTVRRLNDDAAANATARPAPDAQRIAVFLQGQFRSDCLAPQLAAEAKEGGPAAHRDTAQAKLDALAEAVGIARIHQAAPIRQQLSRLLADCRGALAAAPVAMSPNLAALARVPLCCALPAPQRPPVSLALVPEDGAAGGEAAYVALALPGGGMPGPAQPGGAQRLLVLRLRGGKAGGLQAEAAVAAWPTGERMVDVAWYKAGALAALAAPVQQSQATPGWSPPGGGPGGGSGGGPAVGACRLLLLPWAAASMRRMELRAGMPPVLQEAPAVALPEGARWRALGYAAAEAPLAVSGPRGVACVLAGLQRALFLDLEEDEEGGDEDEDCGVLGEDPVT